MHTPDLAAENFRKLATLFPNAVTETITGYGEDGNPIIERAIDADVLRQEIAAQVVEGTQERYQFTWPDKKKSVVLANQPIAKTLRLVREKSVGRDGTSGSIDTENIYIEGDNLDALKLLQETYLGKVKLIYIDPPYNTGSDFIYEDDFSLDSVEYITGSGQLDNDGNRLVQNLEGNGRFHTDWLNMLYPRLRIAKDFLSDDGVIFISIDDNEIENLKKICDELFGHLNYVGTVVWERAFSPKNDAKYFSASHDYVVVYAKKISDFAIGKLPRTAEMNARYKNPDNDPRGPWSSGDLTAKTYSAAYDYPITTPSGKSISPTSGRSWITSKENMKKWIDEGRIWFGEHGDNTPRYKRYLSEMTGGIVPTTLWKYEDVGHSQEGRQEVKNLFDGKGYFDGPKPVRLLDRILQIANITDGSYVLDFFSGSGTTAHAVMRHNAENNGSVKFVLVQLPEITGEKSSAYKDGYKTICEIGEERIRRAGKKIREESPLTTGDLDIGFRVFRVDSSNMKDVYYRPNDFQHGQMSLLADNIKEDRTPEDLLFQVMLDLGVLLSSKIEETTIDGKKVFSVADGYLIACFDKDVTDETVKAIAKKQPFYAVFRDAGIASDSVMTNFEQIFETYSPRTQRKVL